MDNKVSQYLTMNVLQIRSSFSDNGPGTQTLTISEELRKRGHNVQIATSGGILVEKMCSKGFSVHIIEELGLEKRNPINVLKGIKKLGRLLKQFDADIVHAHNAATFYMAYIANKLYGQNKKVKFFQSCRGVELRPAFQWRNWIYKGFPGKIFAVCEFTREILKSFGVSEEKIIVTYNGVDLERFDLNKALVYRQEIRNELNIPQEAKVVGLIGRMGVKGHDLLIEAFKLIYEKHQDLYVVLVGTGEVYENYVELARKLGVIDRIRFTGLRTDAERLNGAFDVFALLSIWGEMFPNAILESMSYGHPFISSNLSGIPEMARNGEGFIVEIGDIQAVADKISLLITNDQVRQQMGNAARQSVLNHFNISLVVNKIENAYKS